LQLFDVTEDNNNEQYPFVVKFTGPEQCANNYFFLLGNIKDKAFDFDLKRWRVTAAAKDLLEIRGKAVITDWKKANDFETGLKLSLYPYQKDIVKFCYDAGKALIVSPCGSGKSPCIISLYHKNLTEGVISGPGLIVVKASLKQQWYHEVQKFSSYKPKIIQTLAQCKKDSDTFNEQFEGADLYIVNFEGLRDLNIRSKLKKLKFQFVAVDEVQFAKDDKTKRSKAVAEFADAKVTIGATATPVQKNPMDIFGIFKFVNPALFPRKMAFGDRYVKWVTFGEYVRKPVGSKNEAELNQKLQPWMIVKTKEEISSQLPSLVVLQRTCTFTPKQKKKNALLEQQLKENREATREEMLRLAKAEAKTSAKLKSLEAEAMKLQTYSQELAVDELLLAMSDAKDAVDYVTGDKSQKTELLIDLLKEILESGEKVAVFSRFQRYQGILKARMAQEPELTDVKVAVIHGALSDEQRYDEVYNKFVNGDHQVLLLTEAGAEGLNLATCGYLVEVDLAQSYAVQTQRHGRIERANSTHRTVYVYQLLTEDSYDDIALKIVNKKEKFDATIIKGAESVDEQ